MNDAETAHFTISPTIPNERKGIDVVCPACGCLCDDGRLAIRDERVIAADFLCSKGLAWFQADHRRSEAPIAAVDGVSCSIETALKRASELIKVAAAPILLGLNRAGIETQRSAVALADSLNARVYLGGNLAATRSFQNVGRVSSTLGEVKQRADFVVFWFVDPVATHPRFLERFAPKPPERSIVVVADQVNETVPFADRFLSIPAEKRIETLRMFRTVAARLAPGESLLEGFAETFLNAQHGAFFFDLAAVSEVEAEEIFLLTRELNGLGRRFVALELPEGGNAAAAREVLTWQTGYSGAVDFSRGSPRPFVGDWAATDLAIIVADDFNRFGPQLEHASTILIAVDATEHPATVAFRTRTPGFDDSATFVRGDGIWLPVRPPFQTDLPTDRHWLEKILEHTAIPLKVAKDSQG